MPNNLITNFEGKETTPESDTLNCVLTIKAVNTAKYLDTEISEMVFPQVNKDLQELLDNNEQEKADTYMENVYGSTVMIAEELSDMFAQTYQITFDKLKELGVNLPLMGDFIIDLTVTPNFEGIGEDSEVFFELVNHTIKHTKE